MSSTPYAVSIVLDREFGSRLSELLKFGPVWIVDSAANRKAADTLRVEVPDRSHLTGITMFKAVKICTAAEILIGEMATIDLHHGQYSADPPYTVLRVFGCEPVSEVRDVLAEFGFDSFTTTEDGFEAMRPLPPLTSE